MSEEKTCKDCVYKRACPCGEDYCSYFFCVYSHEAYNGFYICADFKEKEKQNETINK